METALLLVASESKRLDSGPDPLTVMVRFLVGIAVVFLAMWLLYRWAKHSSLGEYEGPGLRLVSRLALSRSAQVAVVEIGGRMFLVGAGDSTVTPIAELYDTEEMAAELESQAATAAARAEAQGREAVKRPFGQVLAKFSRKAAASETMVAGKPSGKPGGKPGGTTVGKLRTPPGATPSQEIVSRSKPVTRPRPEPVEPASISEAQMDALAAQIAAEFGGRPRSGGAS
ncbi:flagellar biosynthetic protein FliO [Mobiluncus mulieris]|uniref:Flagellar biosynthetic protein FliO n=1 Tax=Mobiluncus mulieris TaxID=2052 RepID=A0A8G2HSE9_9ACTO|nr:flagellar biosynthetic protein FliO [Mobiluncus mulieris]MBB5847063.1 flagellar biogenesis protein FliO [Mobiluncus mulieris]MCU9968034.1 flagellar biosynthetic protein FliO [Mobiluncus mulieris]MCV0009080.1 flagellar biosynthetic protein FliO [Mobiluncus mulieris]NMW74759.1 flagellar biosynthetic protein FliO [Mobiluncus mulieris]NMX18650.1 flagellar biosynthetic protein FliO [Mobiluncus mulieris]